MFSVFLNKSTLEMIMLLSFYCLKNITRVASMQLKQDMETFMHVSPADYWNRLLIGSEKVL